MDYSVGHDTIATYRGRKPRKPKPNPFLRAYGDTERARERLEALQIRHIEMTRAQAEWESLPRWKQYFLLVIGKSPITLWMEKYR